MLNTLRTYLLTSAEHRSPFLLEGPVLLILSSHQFSLRHNGFPLNKMASTTSQCYPRPRAYRRAEDASSWAWSRNSRLLTDLCYVCAASQLRGLDHAGWHRGNESSEGRPSVQCLPYARVCTRHLPPAVRNGFSLIRRATQKRKHVLYPRSQSW